MLPEIIDDANFNACSFMYGIIVLFLLRTKFCKTLKH